MTTAASRFDTTRAQKCLQKIGLPRSMRDRIVVGLKNTLNPGQAAARRKLAASLTAPEGFDMNRIRAEGAALLPAGSLPHAREAAAAGAQLFERLSAEGRVRKPEGQRKGGFLVTIAKNEEMLAIPEVASFILSDELLATASLYFGETPVLSSVHFWWSPPNETLLESQQYHYDGEDRTQLKVLLHVNDVSEDAGPFTYLPADLSAKIPKAKRHSERLTDERIESIAGANAAIRVTGPAGTTALIDTSRCLHYGSRGNSKDRLVIMTQFTRFLAPKALSPAWSAPAGGEISELKRLALDLR